MSESMETMSGKVTIVTGGASGIGLAISRRFVERGSRVVAFCVDESQQPDFEEATGAAGQFMLVDVADGFAVQAAVDEVVRDFGSVDVLVNNASIRDIGSALDLPMDEWNRVVAVNLNGPLNCSRSVGKAMVAASGGSIVNVASLSSLFGFEKRTAYTSTKHAVLGLTRTLAAELGPMNIRVNAVCPGMIETPMTRNYVHDPVVEKNLPGLVPLGRAGQPEDVADVILFLASDEARYVTGVALPVDGGFSASATWDPANESTSYTKTQSLFDEDEK